MVILTLTPGLRLASGRTLSASLHSSLTMKHTGSPFRFIARSLRLAVLPSLVAGLWAQQAAQPGVAAEQLARYDLNRNGRLDPDELAAMQADQAGGQAVQLSPFTVSTTKDSGYFAQNTLAGSRLNTNLSDLAASITVVTKQQLEDTASLDINDVFRYEAGTEGSATYSPVITDRGTAKDAMAGYTLGNDGGTTTNAQSNRVRGLAAPDAAMNYFPTNNRIPFDAYNTQSVEITRGPNSLLFGLGSPSGIVNQTSAQAVLNRNTNTVQLRTDHNGSFRSSLAFNLSLIHI